MTDVLQRDLWNGEPAQLGDVFCLTKDGREAVCALWSHWAGWELRLNVAGQMVATQVCRSQEDVFSTGETWKKNLRVRGWA